MKIDQIYLEKIINEEISFYLSEQVAGEAEATTAGLTDDVKNKVQQSIASASDSGEDVVNNLVAAATAAGETHEISSELQVTVAELQGIIEKIKSMISESIDDKSEDDIVREIIKKLGPEKYRLYSKKKSEKTGKRKNLGTFKSKKAAQDREKNVKFFKHSKR